MELKDSFKKYLSRSFFLIFNLFHLNISLSLFSSQFQVPEDSEESIAPKIGMSFNNNQEIVDLPKLSHKKTKLKGWIRLNNFLDWKFL